MRPTPKFILSFVVAILIGVTLFIYIYFQFQDYLLGPKITVDYPKIGNVVYGPEVEIRGKAERTSSLSLNDNQIFTNLKGNFKEKLTLPFGYNIMKIEAKDRFGKQTTKLLEFTVTSLPR